MIIVGKGCHTHATPPKRPNTGAVREIARSTLDQEPTKPVGTYFKECSFNINVPLLSLACEIWLDT